MPSLKGCLDVPVRVLDANDLSETLELRLEVLPVLSFSRFLADEGTDLSQKDNVTALACGNFVKRLIRVRSGAASTNQDLNRVRQKSQISLNSRNYYCDRNLHRVAIATVQQVTDRTFYRRENRWVDARVVDREKTVQPRRTVQFRDCGIPRAPQAPYGGETPGLCRAPGRDCA